MAIIKNPLTVIIQSESPEGPITINLPSDFATATQIYWFKVNDNTYLISANNPSNIGVWVYKVSTNTITQKYTTSYNWRYFGSITENKCLISSDRSNTGLLLYNDLTETIELKYSSGGSYYYMLVIDDKCFISAGTSSSTFGILLLNLTDNSITKIYNSDYAYKIVRKVTSGYLIAGSGGILLYKDDGTVTKLSSLANVDLFTKFGDDYIITGNYNTNVQMYNDNENTITQIYSAGSGEYGGVIVIDENKFMFSATTGSTTTKGLILYDKRTQTSTVIYTTGMNWRNYKKIGTKILIGSPSGLGLLLYDSETDNVTNIYSNIYADNFQIIGTKCLITSSYNNTHSTSYYAVVVFNNADNTATKLLSGNYDTFNVDGNFCYIEFSDKTRTPFKYKFDSTDNSITLCGYTIV